MITIRRTITALAFAGALLVGGSPAMATKGNCNPAPALYNEESLAVGNGKVIADLRYSWDGVSVYGVTMCDGPIFDVRVRNTDTINWYAHFPNARGGARTLTITPGLDRTFTAAQAAQFGVQTMSDARGLTVDRRTS